MSQNFFQIIRPVHVHLNTDKVDLKKSHQESFFFHFFFHSTHQVCMKNVVKCYKDFFGYFNALKTHSDLALSRNLTISYSQRILIVVQVNQFQKVQLLSNNLNKNYAWHYCYVERSAKIFLKSLNKRFFFEKIINL